MKTTIKKQSGIGFTGIIIFLAMAGFIGYFGLKAFPLYNKYATIKAALAFVEKQSADKVASKKAVTDAFKKNTELNGITYFHIKENKDAMQIQKDKKTGKRFFNITYEESEKLFDKFYVTIKLDETVPLAGK